MPPGNYRKPYATREETSRNGDDSGFGKVDTAREIIDARARENKMLF
jgi:hypothetical protein